MKLKHYTLKPYQLESKHLSQIHNIIEKVVSEKKDEYWDNYTDYSVFDQTMITIGVIDDKVKCFSSIYTREFYGEYVYRLFNRFLVDDEQIKVRVAHIVLEDQQSISRFGSGWQLLNADFVSIQTNFQLLKENQITKRLSKRLPFSKKIIFSPICGKSFKLFQVFV